MNKEKRTYKITQRFSDSDDIKVNVVIAKDAVEAYNNTDTVLYSLIDIVRID